MGRINEIIGQLALCLAVLLSAMLLASCAAFGGGEGGGGGPKGVRATVRQALMGDDAAEAGRMLGRAAGWAQTLLRGSGKHARTMAVADRLFEELESGGELDLGSVNRAALAVCEEAVALKYGTGKTALIMAGVRAGGVVLDRLMADRVDRGYATDFLSGLVEGRREAAEEAAAKTPSAAEPYDVHPTEECGYQCLLADIGEKLAGDDLTAGERARWEATKAMLEKERDAILRAEGLLPSGG